MRTLFVCLLLMAIFVSDVAYAQAPKLPETLEEKVDALAASVNDGVDAKDYLLQLGPAVVPIVTQKINRSLSEGSSEEGAKAFAILEMPAADQKRVRHQVGIIRVQGTALRNMSLGSEVRRAALKSLYDALRSPYLHSRNAAMYSVAYGAGKEGIDHLIPLLNDVEVSNRYTAARMLAMIGDASTAQKIQKVLDKRREGLTDEQVQKDGSFGVGYEAIETLRKQFSGNKSSTK